MSDLKVRFSVCMPPDVACGLDEYVNRKGFKNRSACITELVRSALAEASDPVDVELDRKVAEFVLRALKTYGMFVADHGSPWYLSGPPDKRWDNNVLRTLRRVKGRDFELVQMGKVTEGD